MADISKIQIQNATYDVKDETARNDIAEINSKLAKKKMIVIGDSFSNNAQSGTPLWYKYIEKWDNLDTYTTATDGQGYSTGANTFLHQLQTAKANVNLDEIDRIYIVGGLNDLGNDNLTSANFDRAVQLTFQYVRDNFPNIKCFVVGILPFQFYNFYRGNSFFADSKRAYTFQSILSYTANRYENIIFKSGQYFGLTIPDYFGQANGSNQKHPNAYGEKAIANFIYNSQRLYGYLNFHNTIVETPITCDNGTAIIDDIDDLHITFRVDNYDKTQALNINASGLPVAKYPIITDEKGHTIFMYLSNHKYHIGANSGLDSGSVYINFPVNWTS